MRHILPALIGIMIGAPALARDFTCQSTVAEITCNAGACEVSDSPTPMSLSRSGDILGICAGGGCSEGPVLVRRTRGGIDFLYADVRLQAPEGGSTGPLETLAILYHRASRSAQMHWRSYRNTISCE